MPSAPLGVALRSDPRYRLTTPRTLYLGGVRAPIDGGLRPSARLRLALTWWLSGRLPGSLGGVSAPIHGIPLAVLRTLLLCRLRAPIDGGLGPSARCRTRSRTLFPTPRRLPLAARTAPGAHGGAIPGVVQKSEEASSATPAESPRGSRRRCLPPPAARPVLGLWEESEEGPDGVRGSAVPPGGLCPAPALGLCSLLRGGLPLAPESAPAELRRGRPPAHARNPFLGLLDILL